MPPEDPSAPLLFGLIDAALWCDLAEITAREQPRFKKFMFEVSEFLRNRSSFFVQVASSPWSLPSRLLAQGQTVPGVLWVVLRMKTLVSRSSLLTALSVLPLSKSLATTFGTFSLSQPAAGVYIHIPFCRKRCHYCDFPIKAIGGKESARQSNGESYTSTLLEDIDRWTQANGGKRTAVDTVYFGGGTPSLLPDECKFSVVESALAMH